MSRIDEPGAAAHQTVAELLPWWVNGSLEADERERVEGHLAVCAECAEEERILRRQRAAVRSAADVAPPPNPVALARLWERIEGHDRRHRSPGRLPSLAGRGWRRAVVSLMEVPIAWRAVLAAQLVAIALLVGLVSTQPPPLEDGPFVTLADSAEDDRSGVITVVFDPAASEIEIRHLLAEVGVEIVGGPSAVGVYRVQPVTDRDQPLEVVVSNLRARSIVRFAEARSGAER